MSAVWIAYTHPKDPSMHEDLVAFLQGTHATELRRGIPELVDYTTYRMPLPNGGVRFLSIGRCTGITAEQLRARITALAPELTENPYLSLAGGSAPRLEFVDET